MSFLQPFFAFISDPFNVIVFVASILGGIAVTMSLYAWQFYKKMQTARSGIFWTTRAMSDLIDVARYLRDAEDLPPELDPIIGQVRMTLLKVDGVNAPFDGIDAVVPPFKLEDWIFSRAGWSCCWSNPSYGCVWFDDVSGRFYTDLGDEPRFDTLREAAIHLMHHQGAAS